MAPRPYAPRAPAVAVVVLAAALAAGLGWPQLARADLASEVSGLLARGQAPQALAAAQKAAAADARDAQARFLVGVALMELSRDADALAHFTQMAQEYPELADPHNNIALLHARAGRLELARQALETALRNDPGHRVARANLGQVHVMLAVQAWEAVAAAGPVEPALQRRLEAARALLKALPPPAR
jgi:tetratricopeptide (TPR) repeat protein